LANKDEYVGLSAIRDCSRERAGDRRSPARWRVGKGCSSFTYATPLLRLLHLCHCVTSSL